MANYAYLGDNNAVQFIIFGKDENEGGVDWEAYYAEGTGLRVKRTSFNTHKGVHVLGGVPFRKNFGQIGWVFREDLNAPEGAFCSPQPYPSWILNEETCVYEPPVPEPESEVPLWWDEESLSWTENPPVSPTTW